VEAVRALRFRWGLAAALSLAGLVWLSARAGILLRPAWPVRVAGGVIVGVLVLAAAVAPRMGRAFAAMVATLRLTIVLLFIATWQGDARELLGALAVWVAFRDALEARNGGRPIAPVAIATIVALIYSAEHADQIPGRMVFVAFVAALAAAAGDRARVRFEAADGPWKPPTRPRGET